MSIYNSYTGKDTDDIAAITFKAAAELRYDGYRYDSIAVTGISGLIIGAPLSILVGKPLVVIRKGNDKEYAHSVRHPGIEDVGKRYLFVDDFISTGETMRRVENALSRVARMVGTYEYDYDRITWKDEP